MGQQRRPTAQRNLATQEKPFRTISSLFWLLSEERLTDIKVSDVSLLDQDLNVHTSFDIFLIKVKGETRVYLSKWDL